MDYPVRNGEGDVVVQEPHGLMQWYPVYNGKGEAVVDQKFNSEGFVTAVKLYDMTVDEKWKNSIQLYCVYENGTGSAQEARVVLGKWPASTRWRYATYLRVGMWSDSQPFIVMGSYNGSTLLHEAKKTLETGGFLKYEAAEGLLQGAGADSVEMALGQTVAAGASAVLFVTFMKPEVILT